MAINHNDYVAKITTATPLGLTLITFEIALDNLETALENFDVDVIVLKKSLKKAQNCVNELINSLDMQYDISTNLAELYIYVNKLIINVNFNKNKDSIVEAAKILRELYSGFSEIEDTSKDSVMENADIIYSGLTYKNGKLDEYVDTSKSKDFKA